MSSEWKEDCPEVHVLNTDDVRIMVHKKSGKDDWFLSVPFPPMHHNSTRLSPIDLEGAKESAINILFEKCGKVRNGLQSHLKSDSKTTDSFKLRLIAILDKAEEVQAQSPDDWRRYEPLLNTIKTALSDLG